MILDKRIGPRLRMHWDNEDEMMSFLDYIDKHDPTKKEISAYFSIGADKVRDLVEYAEIYGMIEKGGKYRETTVLYKYIKNRMFTSKQFMEICYFNYTHNSVLGHWFITKFCNNCYKRNKNMFSRAELDEAIKNILQDEEYEIKKNYKIDNLQLAMRKEINKFIANDNFFKDFNIQKVDKNNYSIAEFNELDEHVFSMMFYYSWKKYLSGFSTINISEIFNHPGFPFRTFFISNFEFIRYLNILNENKIIRINTIADLEQIVFTKDIEEDVFLESL